MEWKGGEGWRDFMLHSSLCSLNPLTTSSNAIHELSDQAACHNTIVKSQLSSKIAKDRLAVDETALGNLKILVIRY